MSAIVEPKKKVSVVSEFRLEDVMSQNYNFGDEIPYSLAHPPTAAMTPVSSVNTKKHSPIWNYFTSDSKGANICNLCGGSVSSAGKNTSTMIYHLKRHHLDEYNELKPHLRTISKKEEPFEIDKHFEVAGFSSSDEIICSYCGYLCTSEEALDHIKSLHFEKLKSKRVVVPRSKVCPECSKEFPTRSGMLGHLKNVHATLKCFTCELCGTSFSRRSSFNDHMTSIHTSQRPFLCKVCGKTFKTRSARNRHEFGHAQIRNYECIYCQKKFFTNQQKRKHEKTHTGEKPFKCDYCDKQFAEKHHLKTHQVVHTGEKNYSCPHCSETFKYLSTKHKHKCKYLPTVTTE